MSENMSGSESVDPETPVSATPAPTEGTPMNNLDEGEEKQINDEQTPKPIDLEKARKTFQEKAKNYLIEQASHIVIPSFAKWFDMSEVHQIEKKSFPDFFSEDGSATRSSYKTHDSYKNMRDFMINSYRINPLEYLTVTAIRRNLAGDVSSIIRIHHFLERWGLINYQIDPRTKSTIVGPQYTGHFQVTLDAPKGLLPFIPENIEVVDMKEDESSPAKSEGDDEVSLSRGDIKTEEKIPINLEVRRNVYTSDGDANTNKAPQKIIQYFCNICSKDTTSVRYHNLKSKTSTTGINSNVNAASIICSTCYEQGLFPSNFVSSDFIKLEQNNESNQWSEQEILLLLEGIEMYGTYDINSGNANSSLNSNSNGQWDKIAEYVGSKSKEQCLTKFIQLPIEDTYLNKLVTPKENKDSFDKESLIQDIVQKIVSNSDATKVTKEKALNKLNESLTDQSNLINEIIELTLQKTQIKLNNLDELEKNLINSERALRSERKFLLVQRWSMFERVQKFKQENTNLSPEVESLLNELLKPINVSEVNKSFTEKINLDNTKDSMDIDLQEASQTKDDSHLPTSVAQPKIYQFWSG
ncbi:Piso0_001944 [Millerozyma farinosa CBS 7064]|uniref:Piso0_001944 protein n=1 Tax=Pichia sorbitophila (strain ATCC MYA-4447 / BCRC 22081 / CBS 7064 / NBRC 10061 / NRRL Y-12695) TaxID=559304 RepID=G8YBA0_PICSO|nr:Piso0_001944 [Millerozyma farinosa CBS 7064]